MSHRSYQPADVLTYNYNIFIHLRRHAINITLQRDPLDQFLQIPHPHFISFPIGERLYGSWAGVVGQTDTHTHTSYGGR